MNQLNSSKLSSQFLFSMILFLIITILSVMIIISGKDVYDKISTDRENNYSLGISLSYIANRLRHADSKNDITITYINERPAIIIKERYEGYSYETWIYQYNNYLYEILVDEGSSFDLSDGMQVLEIDDFEVYKVDDNLYNFSVSSNDKKADLTLLLYSNKQVNYE